MVSVALKNNITLTLLKMAEAIETAAGGDAAREVYGEFVAAADAVLELAPGNEKAMKRKLMAVEKARSKNSEGQGHRQAQQAVGSLELRQA